MAVNYNKLLKLLIDKKLIKKDLREMSGISTNAMSRWERARMYRLKC